MKNNYGIFFKSGSYLKSIDIFIGEGSVESESKISNLLTVFTTIGEDGNLHTIYISTDDIAVIVPKLL